MAGAAAAADKRAVATMVKMAEMPAEYLRWVLAQEKEDYRVPTLDDYTPEEVDAEEETICSAIGALQTAYDEFDEFRVWVRGVLEENEGCVMIDKDMLFSDPEEWQETIDQEWTEAKLELDLDLTKPLGPHLYILSTYLSLMYQYAAPVPKFWGP